VLKWLLAALGALVLLLPSTGSAGPLSRSETSLLNAINRVRAQHHLQPLHEDGRLERAARFHSREMLASGAFTHGAFASRMVRFNVGGRLAGENIAWGTGSYGTPQGILTAWLRSPPHRENLLRPTFRRIGIGDLVGAFRGYHGAHVVTADFAG
jgi:uncharacterized protein YkwD